MPAGLKGPGYGCIGYDRLYEIPLPFGVSTSGPRGGHLAVDTAARRAGADDQRPDHRRRRYLVKADRPAHGRPVRARYRREPHVQRGVAYVVVPDRGDEAVRDDAGRSWLYTTPTAARAGGPFQLASIDFVSPSIGWSEVLFNSCGELPRETESGSCENEVGLAATSSAGRTRRIVSSA